MVMYLYACPSRSSTNVPLLGIPYWFVSVAGHTSSASKPEDESVHEVVRQIPAQKRIKNAVFHSRMVHFAKYRNVFLAFQVCVAVKKKLTHKLSLIK